MRKLFLTVIGLLLLAACQTLPKSDPVFSDAEVKRMVSLMEQGRDRGKLLNKGDINTLLVKKSVRGVTREGERVGFSLSNWQHTHDLFATYYDENGHETGRDKGSWWTMGSLKLCGRLQNYDNAKPHCFTVGKQDNEYALVDGRNEQVYRFRVMGDYDPSGESRDAGAEKSNADPAKFSYNLGSFVSYSEVCAQFQGNGADNKLILALKQKFKNDPGFARGYDRFDDYTGSDTIIGLTECDRVKEALEKYYASIS